MEAVDTMNVSFSVPGRPRPQGSKRPIPTKAGVRLVEQVRGLPDWRAQVRHEAWQACPRGPTDLPVGVHLSFVFARPKGHYRANGDLFLSAPLWPAKRSVGDLDKLCRAVFDAVTGVMIVDDSQVVTVVARKVFGFPERCDVWCSTEVEPLASRFLVGEEREEAA